MRRTQDALVRPCRRTLALLLAALSLLTPSALLAEAGAPPRSGEQVRVIVALDAPVGSADPAVLDKAQDALLGSFAHRGAAEVARAETLPLLVLDVDRADIAALAADPRVAAVEEDRLAAPSAQETLALIGVSPVAAGGFSGDGQVVAVLDTGVDLSHPFIGGAVVDGACFSSTREGASPSHSLCAGGESQQIGRGAGAACPAEVSGCGHGTGVAGVIAGGAPGVAIAGVAPGARIVSVQVYSRLAGSVCGTLGSPCALSWTSDQIRALDWVNSTLRTRYSVAAVNMSLGGATFGGPCDATFPTMTTIIGALRAAGIPTVVAAGNGGQAGALSAPACISRAISVGSTVAPGYGPVDTVSRFSNSDATLTLLAPGDKIGVAAAGGGYTFSQGTSLAAPHVAGAWAVLRAARPGAGFEEVLGVLASTGRPVTDPRNDLTRPRIQLDAALAALLADSSPIRTSSATLTFGDQPIDSGAAQLVTLTNSGPEPLAITIVRVTGDFARGGGTCSPGGEALQPGASCTVEVVFRPTGGGLRAGALTVAAERAAFLSIPLSGAGALGRLQIALPIVRS